ncbi:MAG: type II toxin-antitoxin system Phd/YefM family antitoxin [Planctomycetota bacterium]
MTLTPTIIREEGQEKFVVLPWDEYLRVREALEDAEDVRLIEEAKREHEESGERCYSAEEVRRELGLTPGQADD